MSARNRRRSRSLLLLGMLVVPRPDHPLHTTLTEVAQAGSVVTITVRGFVDDLTLAATGRSGSGTARGNADSSIARYLLQKVALISSRGERLPLLWKSVRRQADVVWFTYHAQMRSGLRGTRIANTALCELYEDQVNIVQVRIGESRRSLLFMPGDAPKPIS